MNAQSPAVLLMRAELIHECAAEIAAPLAHLLDVVRVYGHSNACGSCRRFLETIESFLGLAARQVGLVVRRWDAIAVQLDDVLQPDSAELALLLAACRTAPDFSDDQNVPRQARSDWQSGLRLAGLALFLRNGPTAGPIHH